MRARCELLKAMLCRRWRIVDPSEPPCGGRLRIPRCDKPFKSEVSVMASELDKAVEAFCTARATPGRIRLSPPTRSYSR